MDESVQLFTHVYCHSPPLCICYRSIFITEHPDGTQNEVYKVGNLGHGASVHLTASTLQRFGPVRNASLWILGFWETSHCQLQPSRKWPWCGKCNMSMITAVSSCATASLTGKDNVSTEPQINSNPTAISALKASWWNNNLNQAPFCRQWKSVRNN